MQTPVLDRYLRLVRDGALEGDAAQKAVLRRLDTLCNEIAEFRLKRKSNSLGWLFGGFNRPQTPRGVYIWGGVGRGKSMLMDMFYEASPVRRKHRVHFHSFMADVHARIHIWRQREKTGDAKGDDPITPVAASLADEAWLLCFDEFNVSDIADAMILGRLFTALFAQGVIVVATSNIEPARLYEGGLNRTLFTPFIDLLQERMAIVPLESRTDFRLEKLVASPVYFTPADDTARAHLDAAFRRLTGNHVGAPTHVEVLGRKVNIPQASRGVARFDFHDICGVALGATDYLEIALHFHTLAIDNIPVMGIERRNEARRFVWLIDAMYEQQVKLLASADAEPHELYSSKSGREAFEFERAASRLIEMRSEAYLALPHAARTSPHILNERAATSPA